MSLALRKALKARKPTFLAQDIHKHKAIRVRWRKPRGSDSKMRQHLRGYRSSVETGWKSPRSVRGLHHLGLEMVLVSHEKQIATLNPQTQGALISGTVGFKKQLALIEVLQKKKITILNFKDVQTYLTTAKKKYEEKKAAQKAKEKVKEEKHKKVTKKKEEDLSKTISEEEKKQQEKREKDKLLTKAQ